MFATRDQENLVHGHHQAAAAKPLNQSTRGLQPKTPGNKFPKTPLKIPLNDENAAGGFGGKTGKGKGLELTGKKDAFVTPMGPRTRAPLGMKTTNAKAKAFQTPGGPAVEKEAEKTQKPQTSARRPKKVIHADSVKMEVHGDESPLTDRDVEYCPPKPKDIPYESTDFPNNCLDYSALKRGNLMKGINSTYRTSQVDENGMTRLEREAAEAYQKSAKEGDERIMKMMEEEWTVGDVPETFRHLRNKKSPLSQEHFIKPSEARKPLGEVKKPIIQAKGPGTITSRKAASVLSVPSKAAPLAPKASKPVPKVSFLSRNKPTLPTNPSNASTMRQAAATATSRSTIGYTKGRSASGLLHQQPAPSKPERTHRPFQRSISNMSQSSDITITPARFAQEGEQEWKHPDFMKAFEVDDEDLEPGLRGEMPECLRRMDEDDEEFVMTLGSGS